MPHFQSCLSYLTRIAAACGRPRHSIVYSRGAALRGGSALCWATPSSCSRTSDPEPVGGDGGGGIHTVHMVLSINSFRHACRGSAMYAAKCHSAMSGGIRILLCGWAKKPLLTYVQCPTHATRVMLHAHTHIVDMDSGGLDGDDDIIFRHMLGHAEHRSGLLAQRVRRLHSARSHRHGRRSYYLFTAYARLCGAYCRVPSGGETTSWTRSNE